MRGSTAQATTRPLGGAICQATPNKPHVRALDAHSLKSSLRHHLAAAGVVRPRWSTLCNNKTPSGSLPPSAFAAGAYILDREGHKKPHYSRGRIIWTVDKPRLSEQHTAYKHVRITPASAINLLPTIRVPAAQNGLQFVVRCCPEQRRQQACRTFGRYTVLYQGRYIYIYLYRIRAGRRTLPNSHLRPHKRLPVRYAMITYTVYRAGRGVTLDTSSLCISGAQPEIRNRTAV